MFWERHWATRAALPMFFFTPQTGESDIDNVRCPPTDEFERILREDFSEEKFQLQRLHMCSPTKLCSPTPVIILIQGAFQHWHIIPSLVPPPQLSPPTSEIRRGTCLGIGTLATLWQIGVRIKASSSYHLC